MRQPTVPKSNSDDIKRQALDSALSSLFSPEIKAAVLAYFEHNHVLSLMDDFPLTRRAIEMALGAFFEQGAKLVIAEYERKFNELNRKEAEEAIA